MATRIDPRNLIGTAEIAQRLGVTRHTVLSWRRRYQEFPEPVAELEQALVWNWPDIDRWARTTARL